MSAELEHADQMCGATLEAPHVTRNGRQIMRRWVCNRPRWVEHDEHRVTDHKGRLKKVWTAPAR